MSGFDGFETTQPQDFRAQDTYSADFARSSELARSDYRETATAGYSYSASSSSASSSSIGSSSSAARVAHAYSSSSTNSETVLATHSTRNEQQSRGLMSDNQNSRGSDKRKQSLYFPEAMLQEIKDEAARLDRSLSWIVQRAWKTARADIRKIPSVNEIDDDSMAGDEP
jgi:uncharacterized small protein (TIGR04563 family)